VALARARRKRAHAERVLAMAEHLGPSDRALLRGIYDQGMTASDFAQAAGTRPRGIRRRVRRLVRRLNSPIFLMVAGSAEGWPEPRRKVGELVFLKGWSQRETATRLGMSLHRVRQEVSTIHALAAQERAPEGSGGQLRW
jgi:DNA-directed RNA polymerase specialized sigma24 family protein